MTFPRRYLECTLFVGLWMALGFVFKFSPISYLLVGVPLVAVFQHFVARRPLHQLWARDAAQWHLDRTGRVFAFALMLTPAAAIFVLGRHVPLWVVVIALIGSLAGSISAAFALRQQRRDALRAAWPSFVIALVVGCALCALVALYRGTHTSIRPHDVLLMFGRFLILFPAGFVVEEVVFRGALDTHVAPAPTNPGDERISAIFVSVLWGVWHLPVAAPFWSLLHLSPLAGGNQWLIATATFVTIGVAIGVPLSYCWRRSRTLVLPAAAHGFMDAVRSMLWF